MGRPFFQRRQVILSAGQSDQFDTANGLINLVQVSVLDGLLELWVGQGAVAGGSVCYQMAARPDPYEIKLPYWEYVFTATAADNRALSAVVMMSNASNGY